MPNDSTIDQNKPISIYLGIEQINGFSCHHVQQTNLPENDTTELIKTKKIQFDYWIQVESMIPIQYSITYELLELKDTLYQFEKFILNNYKINTLSPEEILTMQSITPEYKIKNYSLSQSPALLPKYIHAPNFSLQSIDGDSLDLQTFKGKLVFLDFFYISCNPCIKAMITLESLYEKYKNKGLEIIGIDPFDTLRSGMKTFLSKGNVQYVILLDNKSVYRKYNVSEYPTIYIIDKRGIIIYEDVGYSDHMEAELEKIIKQNL